MADPITVGIDVSKTHLDVAARPGGRFRVPNDPAGIADLVARVRGIGPALVVMEATGGYEADALAALLAAGLPTAVINPRQVRQFAAGVGQHAKTDPIDAAVLAHFAAVVAPPSATVADPLRAELAALLDRRQQLLGMRVAEANRLRPTLPASVRAGLEAQVRWLDERVAEVDRAVAAAVAGARSGGRRTACCGRSMGSGRWSAGRCWPTCRSWAPCRRASCRRWPGWPRSRSTAGGGWGSGTSAAGGKRCGGRCTWGRWRWPACPARCGSSPCA